MLKDGLRAGDCDERSPARFFFADGVGRVTRIDDWRKATIKSWPSAPGKHRTYVPYVFTEQGVAMLSSVLRSRRAVQVNIEIMRAFVRLRQMLGSNAGLARRLKELESKYYPRFRAVVVATRELMAPAAAERKGRVGFRVE